MVEDARQWLERYASALGVALPDDVGQEVVLELAATAAHASDRTAAPLACWIAALSGLDPIDALEAARKLADD